MVKDMTRGNPLRLILAFCLPMVMGNLFQQFYNMADTIIVGQFVGVKALAAVGATGSLNFLVIGFVLGVCSGFSIPVAHHFGAGDYTRMRRCVANAAILAVGITVVLTAVTVCLTRPMLLMMKTPEDIYEQSYLYIVIMFAGIPAIMLYNLLSGFLRAVGDSKTPLYFLILASVLNVVLDLWFIISFRAGVAGAALATVISQAVSGLLCLLYICRRFPLLQLTRADWQVSWEDMRRLLNMGLPMAFQFSITAVGTIILQAAVNTLGSGVVAAITAANKVQSLVTLPMETLGITMATYCGQNLGAGKVGRIATGVRRSLVVSVVYCILACGLMVAVGGGAARLFISGGAEVELILDQAGQFLRINSYFYPVLGVLFVLRNSIQGLGHGLPAMMAGAAELVARTLVAFCLVGPLGFGAVCFAGPVAWLAADFLLVPVYCYELGQLRQRLPQAESQEL